ncbi:MAG: hypothetical protein LBB07_01450, partial [Bifidobacteriaceae bacterium]|nr:hypothetical protein [Bifidobacteriaceae bacterium]
MKAVYTQKRKFINFCKIYKSVTGSAAAIIATFALVFSSFAVSNPYAGAEDLTQNPLETLAPLNSESADSESVDSKSKSGTSEMHEIGITPHAIGDSLNDGSGTESSPRLINNAQDLEHLACLVNKGQNALAYYVFGDDSSDSDVYLKLNNDISLAGYYPSRGGYNDECGDFVSNLPGWVPIGAKLPFRSHFDGNNHVISDMIIESGYRSGYDYNNIGLFGSANAADIKNLNIRSSHIDVSVAHRDTAVGFLAGGVIGLNLIENIHVRDIKIDGVPSQNKISIGGLLGNIEGTSAVKNCDVKNYSSDGININMESNSNLTNIGGLVGAFINGLTGQFPSIDKSFSEINISVDEQGHPNTDHDVSVGGLISSVDLLSCKGDCLFKIKNSYAKGEILIDGMPKYDYNPSVKNVAGGLVSRYTITNEEGSDIAIENSYADQKISFNYNSQQAYIGGLIGESQGTRSAIKIKNSYSRGSIKSDGNGGFENSYGGIAGKVTDSVLSLENTYSTVSVQPTNLSDVHTSGLSTGGTIVNSAALNPSVIFINGAASARISEAPFTLEKNYAWAGMGAGANDISYCGIPGANITGTNLWEAGDKVADRVNGADIQTNDLLADGQNWFAVDNRNDWNAWDSNVWQMDGGKLPVLIDVVNANVQDKEFPDYFYATDFYNSPFDGAGTEADPYKIASAKDLATLACLVNDQNSVMDGSMNITYNQIYNSPDAHYQLTSDIDLSAWGTYTLGSSTPSANNWHSIYPSTGATANYGVGGWIPIGGNADPSIDKKTYFKGKFSGDGHTISNLAINRTAAEFAGTNVAGLFGYVDGSQFTYASDDYNIGNIKLANLNIANYLGAGGLAFYALNSSFSNIYLESGSISGSTAQETDEYQNSVGGLVGVLENADASNAQRMMKNSYSKAALNSGADNIGGLVGLASAYIRVEKSFSPSSINLPNRNYVGGILGKLENYVRSGSVYSNLTDVYSTGNITGKDFVGGIVGGMTNPGVDNSNQFSINRSYVTGNVIASDGQNAGALIGRGEKISIINSAALSAYVSSTRTTNIYRLVGTVNDVTASLNYSSNAAYDKMGTASANVCGDLTITGADQFTEKSADNHSGFDAF